MNVKLKTNYVECLFNFSILYREYRHHFGYLYLCLFAIRIYTFFYQVNKEFKKE